MPGWILVANRSSFLTTLGKNGGLPSAVLSLTCLVVLTGCSNLRQQSLELPLPVLPSQAAVAAEEINAPVLPLGETDAVVADSSATDNDFDIGFKQTGRQAIPSPSVPSYSPAENDFQPQLQARFVGVLDKAEMSEVKLKAVSEMAPAPAIGMVVKEATAENCKTPEVCNANAPAQCDCCKKKELPQLAVVEPVDPEQLPELFRGGPMPPNNNADDLSLQPMLQPLRSANATREPNAPQKTIVTAKADVNSPIRLTAMQGSETARVQSPLIATPIKTQNRAQLLFPITPDKSKEIKAEAKLVTTQADEVLNANSVIQVRPIKNLNLAAAEASIGVVAMATANEVVDSADASKTQAEFIPVSSSGIRVSAIPFKSFSSARPKPAREGQAPTATKPAVEPIAQPILKKIVEPTPSVEPIEIAKVFQPFEPEVAKAKAVLPTPKKPDANAFVPSFNKSTNTRPVVSTDFPVARTATSELIAPPMQAQSAETKLEPLAATEFIDEDSFVGASPSANIDPLEDLGSLPDMSQIEQELIDFEKENTFDPSTVSQADKIDPAVLLAKLDGPPKKIVAPVAKVADPVPDKKLLTQLAAQSSKLSELQDAVEQLKPKPVVTVHEDPELMLSNAAFCTKISGFGQFQSFAANTFSGSQKTLLYCEVENQTAKRFTSLDGSDQFETVLHGSVVIYDANDRVVQTAKFPEIKDIARKQRRDFYIYFPVQFSELASGDYRLELSVEDVAGNETAVLRPLMKFSVE